MDAAELSPAEVSTLLAYADWLDAHAGVPPTLRELAVARGRSSSGPTHGLVRGLVAADCLYHAVPSRHGAQANDLLLTDEGRARANVLRLVRAIDEG